MLIFTLRCLYPSLGQDLARLTPNLSQDMPILKPSLGQTEGRMGCLDS